MDENIVLAYAANKYMAGNRNQLEIIAESTVKNGITITVNADKTITLNGTSTTNFAIQMAKLNKPGKFKWSMGVTAAEVNHSYFTAPKGDGTYYTFNAIESELTLNSGSVILDFVCIAGEYNNVVIKPTMRPHKSSGEINAGLAVFDLL